MRTGRAIVTLAAAATLATTAAPAYALDALAPAGPATSAPTTTAHNGCSAPTPTRSITRYRPRISKD